MEAEHGQNLAPHSHCPLRITANVSRTDSRYCLISPDVWQSMCS
jgi:hypothetical protein